MVSLNTVKSTHRFDSAEWKCFCARHKVQEQQKYAAEVVDDEHYESTIDEGVSSFAEISEKRTNEESK